MGDRTGIQWSGMYDEFDNFIPGGTLNIGGGCTKVQPACKNCYAMAVTAGLASKLPAGNKYEGLTKLVNGRYEWTNKVVEFGERLEGLVRKTKTKPWFVSSLTDVFHEGFGDDFLIEVYGAFVAAPKQRLYVLTKRPERQADFLLSNKEKVLAEAKKWEKRIPHLSVPNDWPAKNIWAGASAGTQKDLEDILPDVLRTPAVVQWLSLEPLIAPIDLKSLLGPLDAKSREKLLWAVTGGESGEGARPMDLNWVRKIISDCREFNVVPFFKQKGEVLAAEMGCADKKGGDITEWPLDLQVRDWPRV